jgi:hypothetical protein
MQRLWLWPVGCSVRLAFRMWFMFNALKTESRGIEAYLRENGATWGKEGVN